MPDLDAGFAVFVALRRFVEASDEVTAAVADATHLHTTDAAAVMEISGAAAVGQPLSAVDLRRRLRLSPPATTALLDRLERSGHVARHRDAGDRRRVLLSLTEQGNVVVGRMLPQLAVALAEVSARYDPADLAVVARYVDDLVAALGTVATHIRAAPPSPGEDAS